MTDDFEDDPDGRPADAEAQITVPSADVQAIAHEDDGEMFVFRGDFGDEGEHERPHDFADYVDALIGMVLSRESTGERVEVLGSMNGFAVYRNVGRGDVEPPDKWRVFALPWSEFEDEFEVPKGVGESNSGP
jgi:hypothetical protein